MKQSFSILLVLLLCSFTKYEAAERPLCEALKTLVKSLKEKKYSSVIGDELSTGTYQSRLAIEAWEKESISYRKNKEFSFSAVYNARSYKEARSTADALKQTLQKCLAVKPEVDSFRDGESLRYSVGGGIDVVVDIFAVESETDWWIDLKIEQHL